MSDTTDAAAPEEVDAADDAAEENAAAAPRRRLGRKGLVLIVLPALLAVAGGGYAGAGYFGLLAPGMVGSGAAATAVYYYDLPEMVVNLSASEQRAQYLKLKVALEASDPAALEALQPVMPRVLDTFQLYLRELRTSDLEGSAAVFRLKEELLRRINLELQPVEIDRVLFKEIIVQ